MEEDYVAAAVDRSSDRRSAIIYRVAHSEKGCNFDEIPKGTAHGGTVVDKKESGPAFAHRNKKATTVRTQKQYGNSYFSALKRPSEWQLANLCRPELCVVSSFPRSSEALSRVLPHVSGSMPLVREHFPA